MKFQIMPSPYIMYELLLVLAGSGCLMSFPHHKPNDAMEIITAEEVGHFTHSTKDAATSALITPNSQNFESKSSDSRSDSSRENDASNEPVIDTADYLIFLTERTQADEEQKQQKQLQQRLTSHPAGIFQQIDLLTSAEEDSLTAMATSPPLSLSSSKSSERDDNIFTIANTTGRTQTISTSTSTSISTSTTTTTTMAATVRTKHVSADKTADFDDADDDDEEDDEDTDDGDVGDSKDFDSPNIKEPLTPINMSDFVALIPFESVKSIAINYYRNDPEVQHAYAYLSSDDFSALRQRIIELPEVKAFLRYLNSSGLDLLAFTSALTNLTRNKPEELIAEEAAAASDLGSGNGAISGNEIENGQPSRKIFSTDSPNSESTSSPTPAQLNGLHGLVDSILDVLPQDEILATFFDKLETNEQFSKLVENIGRPSFAKILHNMQNCAQLRALIFTLHNNGIYVIRIMDSLKAYFLLGSF